LYKPASTRVTKKIILICIDSLMSEQIDNGIEKQLLPAFQHLISHGAYYQDVVTSFPTMSVSIDSSLLTGTYPNHHGVPGLVWYSANDKKVINYGSGPMEILTTGISSVLSDLLVHLNGSHLNCRTRTLYEELTEQGMTSGSVNGLIYRGTVDHVLSLPALLHVPTSLPREIKVKGPNFFSFGALCDPLDGKKKLPKGVTDKLGFNDEYALQTVKFLIENDELPDFLYVYFADMDHKVHKNGPSELDGVIQVDKKLQSLIEAFGGPDEAYSKITFIIMGDSGATKIMPAKQQPVIHLHQLLGRFNILQAGKTVTEKTEVVLAVNETMAYIYTLKSEPSLRDIVETLIHETRIDFIAWKENTWINVVRGGTSKEFRYRGNGNIIDPYKQFWTIEKDHDVLDLQVDSDTHTLSYGDYPDVLQRLSAALNSHNGQFLVVAAKPGYELADKNSPTHEGGGGHGSLQSKESLIPLIIYGTHQKPDQLRVVDLKKMIIRILKEG
jgi:hypothetical protein